MLIIEFLVLKYFLFFDFVICFINAFSLKYLLNVVWFGDVLDFENC